MRLLILTTTTGYQTREFVRAAEKLGLEVVFGSDRCHVLDDPWQDGAQPLHFEQPEESARRVSEAARSRPLNGIVALGDGAPPTAARAAAALGLPFHSPEAAEICRDKYRSRERLCEAGLPVPRFVRYTLDDDPHGIVALGAPPVGFPCVLKPLALSASRGVIRVNTPEEFVHAFERIRALLHSPDLRVKREDLCNFIQTETYIEGREIAVEGLMNRGRLQVLAIFDKPDPLEGPYFEETIYVTPSRLPAETQRTVVATLERAVRALGLYHGPLHAELRLNSRGVWVLEVAARSIGGLCSRALGFVRPDGDELVTLEEVLIRLALGEDVAGIEREPEASGVMMIPIPQAGIYQEVEGLEAARATPGVEDVVITVAPAQRLEPLPEGASYLGFIFARGKRPEEVEDALRTAHGRLHFLIGPLLPVV